MNSPETSFFDINTYHHVENDFFDSNSNEFSCEDINRNMSDISMSEININNMDLPSNVTDINIYQDSSRNLRKFEVKKSECFILRKDYSLKSFKSRVWQFLKCKLMKECRRYNIKIQIYSPNCRKFTHNINYEENVQFLDFKINQILIIFCENGSKRTNNVALKKLNRIPEMKQLLTKTYEQIIEEYVNSDECVRDYERLIQKNPEKANDLRLLSDENGKFFFPKFIKEAKGKKKIMENKRRKK